MKIRCPSCKHTYDSSCFPDNKDRCVICNQPLFLSGSGIDLYKVADSQRKLVACIGCSLVSAAFVVVLFLIPPEIVVYRFLAPCIGSAAFLVALNAQTARRLEYDIQRTCLVALLSIIPIVNMVVIVLLHMQSVSLLQKNNIPAGWMPLQNISNLLARHSTACLVCRHDLTGITSDTCPICGTQRGRRG